MSVLASLCGSKCAQPLTENDEIVECGGLCRLKFHRKCSLLSKHAYDEMNKSAALSFRCTKCLNDDKKTMTMFEKLAAQMLRFERRIDAHMTTVNNRLTQVEKHLTEGGKQVREELTKVVEECTAEKWSEVVKKPQKKKSPVVVVVPKDKTQKRDETKSSIKNAINPKDFTVQRMTNASKNGVIIECDNSEKCEKLKEEAMNKLGDKYDVQIPKKRNPRVKILKSENEGKNDLEIIEEIKDRNVCVGHNNKKIEIIKREQIKKLGKNGEKYENLILETDGETYNKIMQEGRLHLGWSSCKVVDNIYVRRCYNCYGFNHNASECRNKTVCSQCSSDNHLSKDCKSVEKKCINCVSTNKSLNMRLESDHEAWSNECPVYKRKLQISKRGISYQD